MHNLLEFLQRHSHWLLFVVLEVVSLVLLFQHNSYQSSVWFSSANYVAGTVYQYSSAVKSLFHLKEVNSDLALRNYYLERQVTQLRRLYADQTKHISDREKQELDSLSQYQLIPPDDHRPWNIRRYRDRHGCCLRTRYCRRGLSDLQPLFRHHSHSE